MLNLSDVTQNIKNSELKTALSSLKETSPEALLNDIVRAYLGAQKNYNVTQEEAENPNFLNTIVRIDKQPVALNEDEGVAYQDEIITLRLRNIFGVQEVAAFRNAVRGIL